LADIGGTHARFALADTTAELPLLEDSVKKYAVADFASLGDAALHYFDDGGTATTGGQPVRRGVFAVAGRVEGEHARITNHPWVISRPRICGMLDFAQLELVNDFAAQSMAIPALRRSDVIAIGGVAWSPAAAPADRTYPVIGPGTVLGVGVLVGRDGRYWPLETEGGHVSFPPGTPEEIAIL